MPQFIMRKILRRFSPSLVNRLLEKKVKLFGGAAIAHHGIQRSGTNYLNECLWRCGCPPLNSFDEDRNSSKHKHFRWYPDKNAIPSFLRSQYGNSMVVSSVDEINKYAYPENTVHVVIKKKKPAWLVSILNWGLFCKWFSGKDEALQSLHDMSVDYDKYYSFWEQMEIAHSDRVRVISFESFRDDFLVLTRILELLGVESHCGDFHGVLEEVPMSPKSRIKIITIDDVVGFLE